MQSLHHLLGRIFPGKKVSIQVNCLKLLKLPKEDNELLPYVKNRYVWVWVYIIIIYFRTEVADSHTRNWQLLHCETETIPGTGQAGSIKAIIISERTHTGTVAHCAYISIEIKHKITAVPTVMQGASLGSR